MQKRAFLNFFLFLHIFVISLAFGDQQRCPGNYSVAELESLCKKTPADSAVCSGRGRCVCGNCQCFQRPGSEYRISGAFCECDNYNCLFYGSKLCAGHGDCICQKCYCHDSWSGDACQCSSSLDECMASNSKICNDQGVCTCGVCSCTFPYTGPTCEACPTCPSQCDRLKPCVQCRLFQTGIYNDSECDEACDALIGQFDIVGSLPEDNGMTRYCTFTDVEDDCTFYFAYSEAGAKSDVWARNIKECPPPELPQSHTEDGDFAQSSSASVLLQKVAVALVIVFVSAALTFLLII